jgi:hypothetical protein
MPDHAHVLFELGPKLSVGECVATWKASIRMKMRYTESFQRDFWEHRLRPNGDSEEYGLYTFLNAYRSGLIGPEKQWPGWYSPNPSLFGFCDALGEEGIPPREWIGWSEERFRALSVGE